MTRIAEREPHVVRDGVAFGRPRESDGADGPFDGDDDA
jgi:hypothetical protein